MSKDDAKSTSAHIQSLDVLRGVAFLMVLAHHSSLIGPSADKPALANAFLMIPDMLWCGVDVFFVLSGFLITSILMKARESKHYFRNFYMRRVLRLAPVCYFVLAVISLLSFGFHLSWLSLPPHFELFWLGMANIGIAIDGHVSPAVSPFWSLAVEEQFYLFWSLAVYVLSPKWLPRITFALIAAAVLSRIVLLQLNVFPLAPVVLTFCRMDSLLLGAVVAIFKQTFMKIPSVVCFAGAVIAAVASYLTGYMTGSLHYMNPAMLVIGVPLICLSTAFWILLCLKHPQKPAFPLAGFGILCGQLSYSMYLIHQPIKLTVEHYFPFAYIKSVFHNSALSIVGFPLVVLGLTILAGLAIRHSFEQRFLDMQKNFR